MKMMLRLHSQLWRAALLVSAGFFAGLSGASAATFQYSSYSVTNPQTIDVTSPVQGSGQMGQIVLHGAGPNNGQTLLAWCLDVYVYLQNSGTYQINPLTTAGSGGSNPALTSMQISQIGSLMVNGNALIQTSPDPNVSAAVQLAIWRIEYGNSFAYTNVSPAITALALMLEGYVKGGQWDCPSCTVTLLSLNGSQTLGYGSVVPLPGALPLFASGLVGLGLLRWRRNRKSAISSSAT
jgi:hypothetical protein